MKPSLTYLLTHIDLDSGNRKLYLVNFATLLSFFFLNIFQPLNLYDEGSTSPEEMFVALSVGLFIAFIVLLLTQFALRPLVRVNQNHGLFFVCWFLIESVLVAFAWLALDYRLTNVMGGDGITLWIGNFISYVTIMALPYFAYIAGVVWWDVKNAPQPVKQEKDAEDIPSIIALKDEAGTSRLSLPVDNLRMIQSADNYLEIHHIENGTVKTYLLRNSLKNMEQQLTQTPLMRCHRSYMVNKACIESVKKTSSGLSLSLRDLPAIDIPVSRRYVSEFSKIAGLPEA